MIHGLLALYSMESIKSNVKTQTSGSLLLCSLEPCKLAHMLQRPWAATLHITHCRIPLTSSPQREFHACGYNACAAEMANLHDSSHFEFVERGCTAVQHAARPASSSDAGCRRTKMCRVRSRSFTVRQRFWQKSCPNQDTITQQCRF